MSRSWLLFVLAALAPRNQEPVSRADPMQDGSIWGSCGIGGAFPEGTVAPAPPMLPKDWAVVPHTAGAQASNVLSRWILDPNAPPPTATEDAADVDLAAGRWLARQGPDAGETLGAFTVIESETAEVRMARLTGGAWMSINGDLFVGDPGRRGHRGVPVALRAGKNTVFVAGDGARIELELWKPGMRLVLETFDIRWPGDEDVAYPIFNASSDTVPCVHVHYGHAVRWSGGCKPAVTDWRCGGYIAPLAMHLGASYYDEIFEDCGKGIGHAARDVFVPIVVYAKEGDVADRRLLRRRPDESGRVPNNFENVPRSPDALTGRLAARCPGNAVHVYGTQGSAAETSAGLATARFIQALQWYHAGDVPLVVSDRDYLTAVDNQRNEWLPWRVRTKPVVLHGNADTNAAWSRLVPASDSLDVRRGRARIDGRDLEGGGFAGWHRLRSGETDLTVLFDTGERGARLTGILAVSSGVDGTLFRCDGGSPSGWRRAD